MVANAGGNPASPPKDAQGTASGKQDDKGKAESGAGGNKGPVQLYRANPYEDRLWLLHLFGSEKFIWHRVGGLLYLLMYASAWHLYLTSWERFSVSPLVWALPGLGVVQAISATIYFKKHLPKQADPGYYSDNAPLSHAFVAENIFFSSLLFWQWIYYSESFYRPLRSQGEALSLVGILGLAVECFFTFLPYSVRHFFPKTRFRDSLKDTKNKTDKNYWFFFIGTWVTKCFYVWAKYYIGFFFNFLRFADKVAPDQRQELYRLLLFSCFATTISLFLHTLKFRGFIGPRTSFMLYVLSYSATFYSILKLYTLFLVSWKIVAITAVALVLNFGPSKLWHAWQVLTMALFVASRYGLVELDF